MPEVNADARTAQMSPQAIGEPGAQQELRREWLSYRECETLAGLSRTTLWKLISTGEVDAAKVGRAVRIRRRSLEEFMARHAT